MAIILFIIIYLVVIPLTIYEAFSVIIGFIKKKDLKNSLRGLFLASFSTAYIFARHMANEIPHRLKEGLEQAGHINVQSFSQLFSDPYLSISLFVIIANLISIAIIVLNIWVLFRRKSKVILKILNSFIIIVLFLILINDGIMMYSFFK